MIKIKNDLDLGKHPVIGQPIDLLQGKYIYVTNILYF